MEDFKEFAEKKGNDLRVENWLEFTNASTYPVSVRIHPLQHVEVWILFLNKNSDSIKKIQPYVENALKHGLLHKKKDRILTITIDTDEAKDNLICTIEDNGIGMKASKELNQQRQPLHKSFATSANMKRVNLLNSDRERKIKVEITDLTTDTATGTRVRLIIPI